MDEGESSGKPKATQAEARAARLEQALRDNLRRRKAQAKARATDTKTGTTTTGESEA